MRIVLQDEHTKVEIESKDISSIDEVLDLFKAALLGLTFQPETVNRIQIVESEDE